MQSYQGIKEIQSEPVGYLKRPRQESNPHFCIESKWIKTNQKHCNINVFL